MIHECCMKGFHKLVLQELSTNMLYKSVRQPCCTKGFHKLVLKLWSYINKNIERDLFFYSYIDRTTDITIRSIDRSSIDITIDITIELSFDRTNDSSILSIDSSNDRSIDR